MMLVRKVKWSHDAQLCKIDEFPSLESKSAAHSVVGEKEAANDQEGADLMIT